MPETTWIRRLALLGAILCLGVVVLGGYTRLSNSGLGCPDWPGCFGHIAPTGSAEHYATDLDVRKAWVEMIHRYFASALGIRARHERGVNLVLAVSLVPLVVLQGILGMLTVTWLLKPLIVTGHLLGGLTTFALLQIFLGGWTSSNYAAVACPDLPRCQNEWIPPADYENAFVLWRGLGINYAGGVLDHPARVAIHFTHRLGAVVASLLLLLAAFASFRGMGSGPRWAGILVIAALALQIAIAVFMVLRAFPLELAAAHNAGAALLVAATVFLNRKLRPVPDFR
jgi:cytochrome c oxidase assembly protein subunit 15